MLKGVLTVGGWTMASRILGFARDILIAALAGTGPVADAFFVANKLPNMFRRLFGEGAFNAAFVPEFAGLLAAEGPGAARGFAQEAVSVMTFWLLLLTLLGELFMPVMMLGLAPGFSEFPPKFALAVTLGRITFPYLLLICLAALLSGVLNGLDRFAAAGASQVIYNVFSIAAMLLLTRFVPTVGHALAWGVSGAGVAQLVLLYIAVARAGMPLRIPRPRLTPQMRLLLRRMWPGLIGASAVQINSAVDVIIGSLLPPGTVSLLYYADRVNQLPLGVIGAAVGTALLPMLSRQVRSGEAAAAIDTLNRGIEYALFLTLPAALALVVSGYPIMRVLFVRGAFDLHSATLSAQALAAYALGLPAFVLVKVLAPAFFARGDTSTPVKIGMATLAMNLVLNLALMVPLQHMGPPLASSLAAIFNVAGLGFVLLRRGHLAFDTKLRARIPRMLFAAVVMAATLLVVQRALFGASEPVRGAKWVALAVLVGLGVFAYGVAGQLAGAFDLRETQRRLLRRRSA
jgi:putative peptidoglycan lipid II flippase